MSSKPLCIELFCGMFGWGAGFKAEGWEVIGFDIMDVTAELGLERTEGCYLALQDVLTLHGRQFKDAACIVASPPCQEYSYMSLPFTRGKAVRAGLIGQGEFPKTWTGSRSVSELRLLFDACFRIQREASEAAGRYIPLVVENVRGAQEWVGKSKWNMGSFHLWGDVPALMPIASAAIGQKLQGNNAPRLWKDRVIQCLADAGTTEVEKAFYRVPDKGIKQGGDWFWAKGLKIGGGVHALRTRADPAKHWSGSIGRRRASAQIAKIPFELARHIARVYKPQENL